jgi:hypothetical protein
MLLLFDVLVEPGARAGGTMSPDMPTLPMADIAGSLRGLWE